MNLFGLWVIIFSAATLAFIVSMTLGTLFTTTKLYRKLIAKAAKIYTEDLEQYFEEKEEIKGLD